MEEDEVIISRPICTLYIWEAIEISKEIKKEIYKMYELELKLNQQQLNVIIN